MKSEPFRLFVIFIYQCIMILRSLLINPLLSILASLGGSEKIKTRLHFENKNKTDGRSVSFKQRSIKADYCFEVASQGELEQVYPVIEQLLQEGNYIELVYASESVSKECELWALQYAEHLRIYRMPLISFYLFSFHAFNQFKKWASADKLVLCRYDFYPELLLYGLNPGKKLLLLSAQIKTKKINFKRDVYFKKSFYFQFYNLFDGIVAASPVEKSLFVQLGLAHKIIGEFDFRIDRILARIKNRDITLKQKIFYLQYQTLLKKYGHTKRVILGSAWPIDMEILRDKDLQVNILAAKYLLVIAPHNLNDSFIASIEASIQVNTHPAHIPIYIMHDNMEQAKISKLVIDMLSAPGILIMRSGGILLEMYADFKHAYVGGGRGRSIHSVLEPYLSSCQIYVGPRVERSCEYDFIKNHSSDRVIILKENFKLNFSQQYEENKQIENNINFELLNKSRSQVLEGIKC